MAVETPTWKYKREGDWQTASEMNELAQAVITNATELSNTKDDVANLSNDVTDFVNTRDQQNGYAGLDSNGKVPIEKVYGTTAVVVDVSAYELLPATGVSGVIYYVLNTGAQYKWSGSAYIDITDGADNAKKNETSIFDCSNGTSTKYYSSLSNAINVVPPAYRTSNRIISYLSTENSTTSAVNYQYHGIDSTTWADLTKWERIPNQTDLAELRSDLNETNTNIESVKGGNLDDSVIGLTKLTPEAIAYIGSSGTITNLADGEDLENVIINDVEVIREKTTKLYDAPSYSGLGRIILRKNMIEGVNVLTQSMVNQANTIYEIRYDFDLNGAEITIPEGCVLQFNGGSISNGSINLTDTCLEGNIKINTNISGTVINNFIKPEWFGAKGDGINDDSDILQMCLNISKHIVLNNYYKLTKDINIINDYSTVEGNGTLYFYGSYGLKCINTDNLLVKNITLVGNNGYCGIAINTGDLQEFIDIKPNVKKNYSNYNISNIKVDNWSSGYRGKEYGLHCIGFKSYQGSSLEAITISNCTLKGSGVPPDVETSLDGSDNIYVSAYDDSIKPISNVKIINNICEYAGRQNISIASSYLFAGTNIIISGNYLKDSSLAGVDLEHGKDVVIANNIFINCGNFTGYYTTIDNSSMRSGIVKHADSSTTTVISNNIFKNCYYGISGYRIIASDCLFTDSPIHGGTFAHSSISLTNCKLENKDKATPLISAYATDYGFNFVNCEFTNSADVDSPLKLLANYDSNIEFNAVFDTCLFKNNKKISSFIFCQFNAGNLTINNSTIRDESDIFLKLDKGSFKFISNSFKGNIVYRPSASNTLAYTILESNNIDCLCLSNQPIDPSNKSITVIKDNIIKTSKPSEISVGETLIIENNKIDVDTNFTGGDYGNAIFITYNQSNILKVIINNNTFIGVKSPTIVYSSYPDSVYSRELVISVNGNTIKSDYILDISKLAYVKNYNIEYNRSLNNVCFTTESNSTIIGWINEDGTLTSKVTIL